MPNKSRKSISRTRRVQARTPALFLRTNVGPYVRRIIQHINADTNTWKRGWSSERIATKYGLTKMQVAAVLANYNMGKYNR